MSRLTTRMILLTVVSLQGIATTPALAWRVAVPNAVEGGIGDFGNAVALDAGSNAVVVGTIAGRLAAVKLAPATGAEIWRASVGNGTAFAIALAANGDAVAAGRFGDRFAAVKFASATGQVLWTSQSTREGYGLGVALDSQGNAIVGGEQEDLVIDRTNFIVRKLAAASGALAWERILTVDDNDFNQRANAVAVDGNDDVIAGGTLLPEGNDFPREFVVAKLDGSTGAVIWTRRILGNGILHSGTAFAVAVDGNGDVVATGTLDDPTESTNFFVVKLAGTDGAEKWRFLRNTGDGFFYGRAIAVDAANDVVAVANAGFPNTKGGTDISLYAVKLDDATGAVAWEYEPRNPGGDSGTSLENVAIDPDGNVVTGGTLGFGPRKNSIVIRKLSGATGHPIYAVDVPKAIGYDIAIDADGSPVAVGFEQKNFHVFAVGHFPGAAGKGLTLKQVVAKPAKTSLQVTADDDDYVPGAPGEAADPTLHGATLTLRNPTSGESQVFDLPAASWTGPGRKKGYKYADKQKVGPCASAVLKNGTWSAKCGGAQITYTLDEPAQGSLGATLKIGSETSCVLFGGTISKDLGGEKPVFQGKKAPAPATCP